MDDALYWPCHADLEPFTAFWISRKREPADLIVGVAGFGNWCRILGAYGPDRWRSGVRKLVPHTGTGCTALCRRAMGIGLLFYVF